MKTRTLVIAGGIIILVIGIAIGMGLAPAEPEHDHAAAASGTTQVWTCSMHPQIRQPGPGKCPICGMDLIPAGDTAAAPGAARELRLGSHAAALAEIRTAPVERKSVPIEVRMTGKVTIDETRLAHVTARIPGRIDRMFVNSTGTPVAKGDHLVWLYSPELLTAQQELLQALRLSGTGGGATLGREAQGTLEASRGKLRLWGLTDEQIRRVEEQGQSEDHITIYAAQAGVVIEKLVQEGAYVQTGMRIYTLADLTTLWLSLDAYEMDLAWLTYGQAVTFTAEALPGETFTGRVSFINPVLSDRTRTVSVRVVVDNRDGRLKPGMFVRAMVQATVSAQGTVIGPDLAGKWTCSMHPEIVKDGPGQCDVCGMDLVPAEKLGLARPDTDQTSPLVIPATAPLITGTRAVVYVRDPSDTGLFTGREIILGPRAGDYYIVRSGLNEGELVVVQGNFKIDSALQIQGRPSMMDPGPAPEKKHGGLPQTLCPVMGGAINRDVFVDYKGQRIYFCCAGCPETFMADPENYLKQMADAGVIPEPAPATAEGNHHED